MFLKLSLTASMEAISFQRKESLFLPLVEEMRNYRENFRGSYSTKTIKLTRLADMISKRFNFKDVKLQVGDTSLLNAASFNEFFDINNPLLRGMLKAYNIKELDMIKSTPDFLRRLKDNGEALGGVDLKNARVTGFFSAIPVVIEITRGLLESSEVTDEELVAIVLHEVGHTFTFYEKFGVPFTTNLALSAMTHRAIGLDHQNQEERKVIYQSMRKIYNIDIDPDFLASLDNKDAVQVVVADRLREQLYSEYGSTLYDGISAEYTADNFTVRFGAGQHLISVMSKLTEPTSGKFMSIAEFIASMIGLAMICYAVPFLGIIALALWSLVIIFMPYGDLYDEPKVRLLRMKQGMITELKDPKLSPASRAALAENIKSTDKFIEKFNKEFNVLSIIGRNITAIRRKEYANRKLQQDLEAIGNNDLYVQSGRLQAYV